MRAILFLLLVVLVFVLIRFTLNRINHMRREAFEQENHTEKDPADIVSEPMTTCETCGVHLPKSEAIEVATDNKKLSFCCQEHLEKFIEQKG